MENHKLIRSTTLGRGGDGGSSSCCCGNGGACCSSSHGDKKGNPRSCTYKDFMNFKPRFFNGNEGVVGMTHWT